MRRILGLLSFLLSLQMAIIFQPQYGVPVIGPAFYAAQMFQATMVWLFREIFWRNLVTAAVIVIILVVVSLVLFRGRFVGTLLTFLSVQAMTYFLGEWILQLCVIVFAYLNTLLIYYGIITATTSAYTPYTVGGNWMERQLIRTVNLLLGGWPRRFGTWMVNVTDHLMSFRRRRYGGTLKRYRRAKWIVALICSLGLPIGVVHMFGSFFEVTAYPGWITVVSWGLSLVTYLASFLLYIL